MALPELVAHRGYRLHYPENTLIGVEAALRAGARFVEIDVQLSRDRVPMLFHDETLMRVCGVNGAVKDYAAEELTRMRASEYNRFGYRYAKVHIATLKDLAQLLSRHPDVIVFVELKIESIAAFGIPEMLTSVCAALKGLEERAVLISYAVDALRAARRSGWKNLGVVLQRWSDRSSPIIREIAPQYLLCDLADIPRFGNLAMAASRIAVFEIDDAVTALRLARRGVELIETFSIGELRRAMELVAAS